MFFLAQELRHLYLFSNRYKKQLIFSIIISLIAILTVTLEDDSTQLDTEPNIIQCITILVGGKL